MISTQRRVGCIVAVAVTGWTALAWAESSKEPGGDAVTLDVYDPDIAAADLMAGEKLYQAVCRNCHGPTAKGMASFPKLAGHDAQYLSTQLAEYRSGARLGPNTALMAPHAKELSDEEIIDLAAYIATEFE